MAEEQMVLNRKTGVSQEIPQGFVTISRKQMRKNFMPVVGDIIAGCKVVYINEGKFRFTAEGDNLPPSAGMIMEYQGKIYEIERVDFDRKRYNAVFKGYKQNPVAPPPIEEDETIAKML